MLLQVNSKLKLDFENPHTVKVQDILKVLTRMSAEEKHNHIIAFLGKKNDQES